MFSKKNKPKGEMEFYPEEYMSSDVKQEKLAGYQNCHMPKMAAAGNCLTESK